MEGERTILGRNDHQLMAATGYAGGKTAGDQGRVCYHNFQRLADYGALGHGEVVGMTLPQSKIGEFADLYFSLFDPKTKGEFVMPSRDGSRMLLAHVGAHTVPFVAISLRLDRVDPQDRGGEYRSLLGLPGGSGHASYPAVQEAADKYGFKLVAGKGNDPDTLGKQIVYVYDTKKFPFYQAEVYHQVRFYLHRGV